MKAIVLEKPGRFLNVNAPEAEAPGPDEALVAVRQVGICGTDLHAFRGRQPFFSYPRILGHELGVEVLSVGDGVESIAPGDRCAVEPYLNCGTCIACRNGKANCCENLKVLGVHVDGGMRERFVVPAHKLHTSSNLALEQLALVETLGIGAHAVDRAQVQPGERVLVIGAGPIGLSVIQFAQVAGAQIALLEMNARRMDFARAHFEIAHAFATPEGHLLREMLGGDFPTAVFDATGNAQSMHGAFQFVANGGRLIFVGLVQADITFNDPEFHRREMTLLATRNARAADFSRIVALMEQGVVNTQPWITHRVGFDALIDVFPLWLQPEQGVVKAMMTMQEDAR